MRKSFKLTAMKSEEVFKSAKINSILYDDKIEAYNVALDITRRDYLEIASEIKKNNEFQRSKVKTATTTYALLKDDLKQGCLIPPLVLALDADLDVREPNTRQFSLNGNIDKNKENILQYIRNQYHNIRILDGLQRTNMLISVEEELKSDNELEKLERFYNQEMRLEFYIGINRFGILYRMLTLNTGQTQMTIRHQIEMLYFDYYSDENKDIFLIKEADNIAKPVTLGRYKFSTMVEGLNSYIEESEFTIDRYDLLNHIKGLKKLSTEKKNIDLFKKFVETYHLFIKKINIISNDWKLEKVDIQENTPFGQTAIQIFTKSQVVTGFGAGISNLKKRGIIFDFDEIKKMIQKIAFEDSAEEGLDKLIYRLNEFRKEGKNIGDIQRTFFRHFFEALFDNNDMGNYLNIDNSVQRAYNRIYARRENNY